MNFKKVEKAAKKINQLLANLKEEENVSRIEKDLLLSYIRDLYEKVSITDQDTETTKVKTESKKQVEAPLYTPPTPQPPTPIEIAEVVKQEITENTPVNTSPSRSVSHMTPATEYSAPEPTVTVMETESATPAATRSTPQAPQELLAIFETASTNELSDKLGRSPIADLTKCMGINERIFTVNELFGGNSNLFNTTMKEIDGMSSLEQARDYLVTNVAIDQNWGSEAKLKKAANFVKLISRRY